MNNKMILINHFMRPMRCVSVDQEARTKNGVTKTNVEYPGCKQWGVRVLVPEQIYESDAGQEIVCTPQTVSVWLPERPTVREGQYVVFDDVKIGAFKGDNGAGLYMWSSGVREAPRSSSLLEVDDND